MDESRTLYVATRKAWRAWLEAHYDREPEIWLVTYRKHTRVPSVPYNDAVEEALCFGWIDSTRKGVDKDRLAQKFSPRKTGSAYSQTNKERLARLSAQGRLIDSVETELQSGRPEDFKIPKDIRAALEANEAAWRFFKSTSPSYQRIRAAYVDRARDRNDEFTKRLKNLINKSAKGRQFGYGIEDYY